jgi:hypothetical protein
MDVAYQAEKLSAARRVLMLPHPRGEAESIAEAFELCSRAFFRFDTNALDDNARRWILTIKDFMDTSGIDNVGGRGTYVIKAERLTNDEKRELSNAVDELAHWFKQHFWDTTKIS